MSNLRLAFIREINDLFGTLRRTWESLRGGDIRKLGYETFVVSDGGTLALRHFGTDIVRVRRVDSTTDNVTLNASGYRSKTTADRMRRLFHAAGVPVQVYVQDGDYMVSTPMGHYPYRDGMSFHVVYSRDGHVSVGSPTYPK
jgi:hypothetical protein